MYLVIIFLTSLIGLFAMIFYRKQEIKAGKVFVPDVHAPIFPVREIAEKIHAYYVHTHARDVSQFIHSASMRGKNMIQKLVIFFDNTSVKKQINTFIDKIKGRQNINSNGRPSSPFIQDILEHKEHIRNNKYNR